LPPGLTTDTPSRRMSEVQAQQDYESSNESLDNGKEEGYLSSDGNTPSTDVSSFGVFPSEDR
jgi:hypothetical protein